MSGVNTVQQLNRELARKINEAARGDPHSPYANKFVGIANGQVVVVADDLNELSRRLRQAEPDPTKTFFVEASRNYDEVEQNWGLSDGGPCVRVTLTLAKGGQPLPRILLADTGAGSRIAGFELVLQEDDCLLCGGIPAQPVLLGGTYSGSFQAYILPVRFPALGFNQTVRVVAVPSVPVGINGFINRFAYENLADRKKFGLEG